MKNIFFVLFFLSFYSGFSQTFEKSDRFLTNNFEDLLTEEYYAIPDSLKEPILITVTDSQTKEVKYQDTLFAPDVYAFSEFRVYQKSVEGFKNVSDVVRISYGYSGCCSDMYVMYFLVKTNGEWVDLPELNYVICDWPADIPAYNFEAGQHPVVQEVNMYQEYHNSQGDIYKKELLTSYEWNGKFIVKKAE